jgi:hypothetical protein
MHLNWQVLGMKFTMYLRNDHGLDLRRFEQIVIIAVGVFAVECHIRDIERLRRLKRPGIDCNKVEV